MVAAACRVCGWGAPTVAGLCIECQEVRQWSRINRAFCDLLHRERHEPSRSPVLDGPGAPVEAVSAVT